MDNRELILSSIQMMEDNLLSRMSVLEISKELGFSFYYYSKLFKIITGYTPKAYMLGRKITDSVQQVVETNNRIIDIALDYGFGSSEAYSRAFNKILGMNPSEVRKLGKVNRRLLIKPITDANLKRYEHAIDREPDIVFLDELKLVGIPFYHDINQVNSLSNQWELLMGNKSLIKHIKQPEEFYQMQFSFPNEEDESMYFYIATAVEDIGDVPIQFASKIIAPQEYYRFRHKGLANEVGHTYKYIYEEWLPAANIRLSTYFNFEYYGCEYLGPYNRESISEIYIPVKSV